MATQVKYHMSYVRRSVISLKFAIFEHVVFDYAFRVNLKKREINKCLLFTYKNWQYFIRIHA